MISKPEPSQKLEEETKRAVLVPLWIVNPGNAALAKMSKRPVMVAIDELGKSFLGHVQELSATHATVVPEGCFYLCKSVYVEIAFRFEQTQYSLTGQAKPSTAERSFRMEFDTVARKTMSTLGVRLGAAGLIESGKLPASEVEEESSSTKGKQGAVLPGKAVRWVRHESPPEGIERRQHHRYEVDTATRLTLVDGETRIDCTMIELSLGGCRLFFSEPCTLACGTNVEVQFVGDGLPLRLAAVIQVRSHDQVAGLRFVNVVPRMRERLEGLTAEIALGHAASPGS